MLDTIQRCLKEKFRKHYYKVILNRLLNDLVREYSSKIKYCDVKIYDTAKEHDFAVLSIMYEDKFAKFISVKLTDIHRETESCKIVGGTFIDGIDIEIYPVPPYGTSDEFRENLHSKISSILSKLN